MDSSAFDHAVVVVRDRMDDIAPRFERGGFTLSELSTHNLGSQNRLMVFADSFLELLGWPAGGQSPRPEIASSPLAFDALVLRTIDAPATWRRLDAAGFAVNPVQHLTRPAVVDGLRTTARFATVRFARQPIDGLRLYFCQHLTPECVWRPELMAHPIGARTLRGITMRAGDRGDVADRLRQVAGGGSVRLGPEPVLELENVTIRIVHAPEVQDAVLTGVTLGCADGTDLDLELTAEALAGDGRSAPAGTDGGNGPDWSRFDVR